MQTSSSRETPIGPQLPPGFGVQKEDLSVCEKQQIGPALPPNFTRTEVQKNETNDWEKQAIGPALPPNFQKIETDDCGKQVIGPALPPHFKRVSEEDSDESENSYGPCLPPHLKTSVSFGPALPRSANSQRSIIGPVLPRSIIRISDDSDEEGIGPKLYEAADTKTQNECTAASDFERRAEKMKDKLLSKDTEVKKRDEWMTELPSRLGTQIGLGPRSFKKHSYTDKEADRSEWTDTPADRKRKAEEQNNTDVIPSTSDLVLDKRNRDIAESLKEYNKTKRKESLLDIHKKKRKSSEEKTKKERKEFDRDKDLNITKVDAAQAKNFIDKARLFNGKFSHGASHFL